MSVKEITKLCAIPLVLLLLSGCEQEAPGLTEPAVRPAKIVTLETADKLEISRYPAFIEAAMHSELAFQVGGLLIELPVTESQIVKKGQLIARLDPRNFMSDVKAAKSQFDLAEQEYQRAARLAKRNAIAKQELEQRRSARDSAQVLLDIANKSLGDSVLKAPYDGVIVKVPVKQHQNIQPGTQVVALMGNKGWEATINLPASVIAATPTRQEEGALVILDGAPSAPIPATFVSAVLEADAVSQTYAISFGFEAPENQLILPGMNATVELKSSDKTVNSLIPHIAVPLAAVMSEGQQQFVWVVDSESMRVNKRLITVQQGIGETLVITDGLSAGESIVTAGAAYLSEGVEVRPWTD